MRSGLRRMLPSVLQGLQGLLWQGLPVHDGNFNCNKEQG